MHEAYPTYAPSSVDSLEPRRLMSRAGPLGSPPPDPSFGQSGVVSVATGPRGSAGSVAVQPDQKILVAGSTSGLAVARYNADGTPDLSFTGSGDGVARTIIPVNPQFPTPLAVAPDGDIIVAATDSIDGTPDDGGLLLARFNSDGRPDVLFGQSGMLRADLTRLDDVPTHVLFQPDGKLLVALVVRTATDRPQGFFQVTRFNVDGSVDTTFGDQGSVTELLPDAYYGSSPFGLAMQPAGGIVVGVRVLGFDNPHRSYVFRYDVTGRRDSAFAPEPVPAAAVDLAVTPDGAIRVAAESTSLVDPLPDGPLVFAFAADGGTDQRFGNNGVARTDFGGIASHPRSLAVAPDGRVIVAGLAKPAADNDSFVAAVASFTPDGRVERRFGRRGAVLSHFGVGQEMEAIDVAADAQGRVLALARGMEGEVRHVLARYPTVAADGGDAPAPNFARLRRGTLTVRGTPGSDTITVRFRSIPEPFSGGLARHFTEVLLNEISLWFPHDAYSRVVVHGGTGDDAINTRWASGLRVTTLGGPGNDRIETGPRTDRVIAGPGNDVIFSVGDSIDVLLGGPGRDTVERDTYVSFGRGMRGADFVRGVETVLPE